MKVITKLFIAILLIITFSANINFGQKFHFDIKASNVNFSPKEIMKGDSIVFTYLVENESELEIPAKSYQVEFYIDNELFNFDYSTPKLLGEKGKVKYSTPRYYAKVAGEHFYKLVIKTKEILNEVVKHNNTVDGYFYVKEN